MMISEKKKVELSENTQESCFHFCFISGPARGQKFPVKSRKARQIKSVHHSNKVSGIKQIL